MTGEFRTARGWRIFIYFFAPLFIALFAYLGTFPFTQDQLSWPIALICIPISLGMIGLFGYGLVDTVIGKLIIEKDKIATSNLWVRRQLQFDEIKGFREDSHYIHIIPLDPSKKRIKVSLYLENTKQISAWLAGHFPELKEDEALEGADVIMQSNEFGLNREAREYRLSEAKRICRIANATGFVMMAWIVFYPKPYLLSVSISLMYPLFVLLLLYFYRGLVRMDEKKNSAYPSISTGFIMGAIGLMVRGFFDYDILDYSSVWMPTAVITVALLLVVMMGSKKLSIRNPEDYLHFLGILVSVWIYSFGGYVISNCMYDKSKPEVFSSRIVDKEITTGKSSGHYLKLAPWGNRTGIEKVNVGEDEFMEAPIGKEIVVYQMKGLFKTPWFYLDLKPDAD